MAGTPGIRRGELLQAKKAAVERRRNANKGKTTIPAKGGKPAITFQKGGLHRSTNTPMGQKIPASKMAAAMAGKYGPKAKRQAQLAKGLAKMRGGK